MIRSRRWAILYGTVVGLLVGVACIFLAGFVAIGQAHASPDLALPGWMRFGMLVGIPLLLLLLGWVAIGVTAVPYGRLAAVAAVGGSLLAFAGLIALPTPQFQDLTITNQSVRALVVSWLHDGVERPYGEREIALAPGESRTTRGIITTTSGSGIRVFADDENGVRVFERTYAWDELRRRDNTITIPD